MIDRIRNTLLLAAAVAALLMVPLSPASAQESEMLTVDDILPGDCSPALIVVGQYSDCRFPLARPVTLDTDGGPYLADDCKEAPARIAISSTPKDDDQRPRRQAAKHIKSPGQRIGSVGVVDHNEKRLSRPDRFEPPRNADPALDRLLDGVDRQLTR